MVMTFFEMIRNSLATKRNYSGWTAKHCFVISVIEMVLRLFQSAEASNFSVCLRRDRALQSFSCDLHFIDSKNSVKKGKQGKNGKRTYFPWQLHVNSHFSLPFKWKRQVSASVNIFWNTVEKLLISRAF